MFSVPCLYSSVACTVVNATKPATVLCVQANDMYLEMAIGNAPWPIGVTMVGIHARTGREKIFAQNVARILSVCLHGLTCFVQEGTPIQWFVLTACDLKCTANMN